MEPAGEIPVAAASCARCWPPRTSIEGSHDYKAAVALFDTFPKDELFSAATDDAPRDGRRAARAAGQRRCGCSAAATSSTAASRCSSPCPATASTRSCAHRLQDLFVERFHGSSVDYHLVLGETDRVPRSTSASTSPTGPCPTSRSRSSSTRSRHSPAPGRTAARAPGRPARRGARSRAVERLGGTAARVLQAATEIDPRRPGHRARSSSSARGPLVVALQNEHGAGELLTRVALYKTGGKVDSRRVMPMLEDLGLRVVEEVPRVAAPWAATSDDAWCRTSACSARTGRRSTSRTVGERVADRIAAVWRGETESDTLNRLVIVAGLDLAPGGDPARATARTASGSARASREGYQNDVLAANPAITAQARAATSSCASTPTVRARRGGGGGAARSEILADLDAVAVARPRPHPAQPARADRRDAAHERLPTGARRRSPSSSAPPTCPAIPQPCAAVRDLRLLARDGGHPPARRPDRARRHPLVGPRGLPHRGLRPDARAADQERRDRPGGRQGRLLRQAPRVPRRGAARRGRAPVRRRYIRGLLDLTDNLVDGEVVHPPDVRVLDEDDTYLVVAADKGTATFSDTANARLGGVRLLARRRVRLRRLGRLRPQGARDHRARRVGVGQAPLPRARPRRRARAVHRRRHRRHVRRRVRQRDAALASTIRLVAAYDHRHVFIDPDPGRAAALRRAQAAVRARRARRGTTTTARAISAGGGVWPRSGEVRSRSRPRRAGALGIEPGAARAERPDPRDPARAGRPALERRHRHVRQGHRRRPTRTRRPLERRDPRRREASCARRVVGEGGNLGLTQPRPRRVRRAAAARSTPTSSTTRPASTAPTTRST